MKKEREIWIDNVKVFACVLVALGHFLQSMTKSQIVEASFFTQWFDNTVYFFHVPLFFVCSGYLYQKYSRVETFGGWKTHALKKLITLGIPYFVFTFATWLLKTVFSGAVNTESGGLLETFFIFPTAPYWFLYALFFLFLIIPTFRGQRTMIVVMAVALIWKLVYSWTGELPVYLLSVAMANAVWFAGGMVLAKTDILKKCRGAVWLLVGIGAMAAFLALSVFLHILRTENRFVGFGMGLLACSGVLLIMNCLFSGEKQSPVWGFMARYTMPVFLMHTIFAAGWRSVLMKVGVSSPLIHVVTGLIITFAGPIAAAWIMSKIKFLDFPINPGRYIRIGKKKSAVK